ncbi:aspartate ammonia-lyase [Megasphaera sp. ASD88]|jgi:aspartate ammonia-lyase|uniref:aspartate ammonia-lyase n=1 Tax=Megasphaera sp. ASD88 TaxID=2027407 RepID=UPI000BAB7D2C|nr:aspartate ammonia-lyase [Megasphaera sp. ASD88]PAV38836.1 aspartate ammonia-lyase [Megasphaera sp. ASD88]
MRKEHDFLGTMNVPDDVYYGVQTMRAVKNFHITGERLDPDFIKAMATVKKAAALANMETGRLNAIVGKALTRAADEIIEGRWLDQFPVDPIQGGAGTSINMNMNEVLCNRALEILGKPKGRYDIISPNNHANMAQSTNDVFPTSIKVCLAAKGKALASTLRTLEFWLDEKADEFRNVLKMGRTHLQDAVPITLGQEMAAYASAVRRARRRIETSLDDVHVVNMGGTAVGTGLNAEPEYSKLAAAKLSELTGEMFVTARNMVDATNNTDVFADVSGSMKSAALVLIKMANDIRLMASGPRCGLHELNVPPRQPGSSIMPGKVNPVIAEVLDQTCYQVIGNDMAITLGVENGQFELNVMEPVMAFNLFHSMDYLTNAVQTFVDYLLKDLQANTDGCRHWVDRSVGVITALLPHIGYEEAAMLAKEAYSTGRPVRDIILAHGTLTKEQLDVILSPQEMTKPGIAGETFLHRQDGRKLASN